MRRFSKTFLLCLISLLVTANLAFAGEIDILLEKLVEKGVLSGAEAQQIKIETKETIKKEIAAGKSETLPSWLQNIKVKGDFRLRYQYNRTDQENNLFNYRHRGRIRLRLGVDGKVNEKLKVGVGLATGTTDVTSPDAARSTNQTMGDFFAKKPIALDYAYAEYTPAPWVALLGGKFNNPLWLQTDLVWDSDINPEGAVAKFSKRLVPGLTGFFNTGAFILDESSSISHDPMMYIAQAGAVYDLLDNVSLKGSFSYYNFSNIKGSLPDGSSYDTSTARAYGNTRISTTNNNLKYGYATLYPALEVKIKEPFKDLGVPSFLNFQELKIFGEYVKNPHLSKNASGYMAGLGFGAAKIENWGDWNFKYNYAMLERDAVPDFLPDSDRYGGTTGIRAHEAVIQYGLGKNTYLAADYYCSWRLTEPHVPEHLIQLDWNLKF